MGQLREGILYRAPALHSIRITAQSLGAGLLGEGALVCS